MCEPFFWLLNSLASSYTLVNLSLQWDRQQWDRYCPASNLGLHLMKKATWPSLKKLTLLQSFWTRIGDPPQEKPEPREESVNACFSFFARHPQLERLYLCLCSHTNIERFLAEHGSRLSNLLPSLQSLYCDCPVPPGILSRLVVTNMFTPTDHYALARSLRSCIITLIDLDNLEALLGAKPSTRASH